MPDVTQSMFRAKILIEHCYLYNYEKYILISIPNVVIRFYLPFALFNKNSPTEPLSVGYILISPFRRVFAVLRTDELFT